MAERITALTPAPLTTVIAPQPLAAGMHTAPHFDLLELLPPAAADKLRMLRQRSEDAHALIPEFESIREASMARIAAENRLKQLQAHPQEFGLGLKPDDVRVTEAQRHLDKLTADFERLKQLQDVRTAAWQTASQAMAACEAWLKTGRPGGTVLEAVEVEPPRLNKGESITDAIERLRRRARERDAAVEDQRQQVRCFSAKLVARPQRKPPMPRTLNGWPNLHSR